MGNPDRRSTRDQPFIWREKDKPADCHEVPIRFGPNRIATYLEIRFYDDGAVTVKPVMRPKRRGGIDI